MTRAREPETAKRESPLEKQEWVRPTLKLLRVREAKSGNPVVESETPPFDPGGPAS